jgi:hypothetical protein
MSGYFTSNLFSFYTPVDPIYPPDPSFPATPSLPSTPSIPPTPSFPRTLSFGGSGQNRPLGIHGERVARIDDLSIAGPLSK